MINPSDSLPGAPDYRQEHKKTSRRHRAAGTFIYISPAISGSFSGAGR